jgi:hypothetical protein
MRKTLLAAGLAAVFALSGLASVASAHRDYWGCNGRADDGQCVVTVSIAGGFPASEEQIIREVLANFSESPNIEAVVGRPADVQVRVGNEGFWTDLRTRVVTIDKKWFGYCCDQHDGMRGVYCHELMHAIAGIGHPERFLPSCHNGTSPHLGVEDFADIAAAYPLP